jgi:hypothetical protein
MSNLEKQIEQAREEAHQVCNTEGVTSGQCAAAWDALEELQAEAAHQRTEQQEHKTSFQQYCDDNPDAAECRIYDD